MAKSEMMRLRRQAARLAGHNDYGQIHLTEFDPSRPHVVRVWTTVGRGQRVEAVVHGPTGDGTSPLVAALRILIDQLAARRNGKRRVGAK